MKKSIQDILFYFGTISQKEKAIEELEELIEAIKEDDADAVLGEVADVYIMLEQVISIYKLPRLGVNFMIEEKIDRTLERIDSGYYGK